MSGPAATSSLTRMRETPIKQVVTCKAPSMQRMMQMMHTAAQKSCLRACQLFCLPLDPLGCCTAKSPQPKEDKNIKERVLAPPSTVLIVNISNSTLIDCVIGDSSSAVADRQPLVGGSDLQKHAQVRCSCSFGQQGAAQGAPPAPVPHPCPSGEGLSVSICGSHLSCVIIGDNNHMHAEQNQPFE